MRVISTKQISNVRAVGAAVACLSAHTYSFDFSRISDETKSIPDFEPEPAPSMATMIPATSDIPFFSSLHGKRRRAERGIDRRDLQAAVKHGKKQLAKRDPQTGARRWKYTYADIIYITDATSTQEITSWVVPIGIPMAKLTLKQIGEHEAAKERLKNDPTLCTSHTVIIVDQSGSMRETDVADFYNRSQAVFGMLALDFVAKPRLSGEASDTDVVSLVLMQDSAQIVVEREPSGLVLYNQLVGLHDEATPGYNGNFLPALDLAEQLLNKQRHAQCALSLLFLSDGRPSDHTAYLGAGTAEDAADKITGRIRTMAGVFGEQLSIMTLGFAGPDQDFSVLEAMAQAARDEGAHGKFLRPEMSSKGLGTAIADSVSSLTATRLRLTTLAGHRQPRELRHVEREAAGTQWGHAPTTAQTGDGWVVYTTEVQGFEFSQDAMKYTGDPWISVDLFSEEADGIAIRSKALGEGAERLVFGLQVCTPTRCVSVACLLRSMLSRLYCTWVSRIFLAGFVRGVDCVLQNTIRAITCLSFSVVGFSIDWGFDDDLRECTIRCGDWIHASPGVWIVGNPLTWYIVH